MLIRGGKVLDARRRVLTPADILIKDGRIAAVEANLKVSTPGEILVIDASGCIVLPGLVNAHTHAHNNINKGVGDNWTLEDLLNYAPALYGSRTPEEQYVSAAIGAVEMVRTGCTAAFDMFTALPAPTDESIEAVVRAYADVGIRAVLAPQLVDAVFYYTVPGILDMLPPTLRSHVEQIRMAPAQGLLQSVERALKHWQGAASGRIGMAVAPAIPNQCTDELLLGCGRLAKEYGVPLQTHTAESKLQAVYALQTWGRSIVGRLADMGLLSPRFVGSHCVWLTTDDIRMFAYHGAAVAHNPASNLKLGSGIAPVREMLNHGVCVGLGTDGSLASDNQNMFESARFAALISKVRFPQRPDQWLGAGDVWNMATVNSSRCLGLGVCPSNACAH